MQSLLSSVDNTDVVAEPFPHVIITNPIDNEICLKLISELPSMETLMKGVAVKSNQRFSYTARDILSDESMSPLWKQLVRVHTSNGFFRQVIGLFKEHILRLYPWFESSVAPLTALRCGVRNIDSFNSVDLLLDAQISINTPVVGRPSSVRRVHVDDPRKLFSGLYYLRHSADRSVGGDLELYKFKGKPSPFGERRGVDEAAVEVVKRLKYERNIFILFINSPHSLHGVTVRSATKHPRYFLNVIGELMNPLFELSSPRGFSND